MCKYCEMKLDEYFTSLGYHGATIVSDCAAECEIAKVIGVHHTTVSRRLQKIFSRFKRDT